MADDEKNYPINEVQESSILIEQGPSSLTLTGKTEHLLKTVVTWAYNSPSNQREEDWLENLIQKTPSGTSIPISLMRIPLPILKNLCKIMEKGYGEINIDVSLVTGENVTPRVFSNRDGSITITPGGEEHFPLGQIKDELLAQSNSTPDFTIVVVDGKLAIFKNE